MKTIIKRLSIVIISVLIVSGIISYSLYNKKRSGLKDEEPSVCILSTNLVNQFETNENDANKKYLGEVLQVGGVVEDINIVKNNVNVYLRGNDLSGVSCDFDTLYLTPKNLKTGDVIEVKGECTGFLMDVVMINCVLIEKSK